MTELTENRLPINQVAKFALNRAKADADPRKLYCLQAAKWALDSGKEALLRADLAYQLKENLEALLYRTEPADAMLFLEGEHNLMADLPRENERDALTVGVIVLEQLDSRLSATLPGYLTAEGVTSR